MPPIIPDRLREEEGTDLICKIVAMLRPHNSWAMQILHCSNVRLLQLFRDWGRASPFQLSKYEPVLEQQRNCAFDPATVLALHASPLANNPFHSRRRTPSKRRSPRHRAR